MKFKIMKCTLAFALLFTLFSPKLSVEAKEDTKAIGTTYYVSSLEGSDAHDGKSRSQAFASLQKINEITLAPGDKVLLQADSVFSNGFLHIKGSGNEEAPIVIDRYGEGNDPIIHTNGQGIWYQNYGKVLDSPTHKNKGYVSSSILLYDVEYIEINNLEITNIAPKVDLAYNSQDVMNRTGVAIVAQDKGTIDHVYLNSLNIHDVIGNVYDKHMNNGGIYFTVAKPKDEQKTGIARYNDLLVQNCIVSNVNRWGIGVGYSAYWDKFSATEIPDQISETYGATNVVIKNNYVKEAGGDAITTMYCHRPLIEYNVSDGAARQINTIDYSETGNGRVAAAIWPWKCKDAIFQYNEAFDTYLNQDGQAWDADSGDGTIYQYNYSHNNGGGAYMACASQAYKSVFRYNISENDLSGVLNLAGNPKAEIYNNVFYIKEGVNLHRLNMSGGVASIENNIIYNAGAKKDEDWYLQNTKATYSNNIYYNYNNVPSEDKAAITEDPKLVNPGSGPSAFTGEDVLEGTQITHNLDAYAGYKLQDDSPAINAGTFIASSVQKDFFNNPITGKPDIGVFESNVASLYIYSTRYDINQEDDTIVGLPYETTIAEFKKNIQYDEGVRLLIKNDKGKVLTDEDIIKGGCSVTLLLNGNEKVYTVIASGDHSLYESIFMMNKDFTELYVPSLSLNPTSVRDVIQGTKVHSSATKKVYNGTTEVSETSNIEDGMLLKVIAENGTERAYTLRIKNSYDWAGDYVDNQQGNVWFAQYLENESFANLTSYDATWPQWNGDNYGGVGIDEQGHNATITKDTHGLLVDTMTAGGKGYAMAYRAPKDGYVNISLKDNEPYLRQAAAHGGNSGGSVFITYYLNDEPITKAYKLNDDGSPIKIEDKEILVKKGDYIRIVAKNEESPKRGSVHITPRVEYVAKKVPDHQAPTPPSNIQAKAITYTSASITWHASSDNQGVEKYELYHDETLLGSTDTTSYVLENLLEDTEYTISIYAFDAAGNKSEAGTITFHTQKKDLDHQAPTPPSNIQAEAITFTSASVTWQASSDNQGVKKYELYHDETLLGSTDTTSYVLENLLEDTEYIISIYAFDAAGNKSEAGTITFHTQKKSILQKDALTKAITDGEQLKKTDVYKLASEDAKQKFDNVFAMATSVLANEMLLQENIDEATRMMNNIIQELTLTHAHSMLTNLVTEASRLPKAEYTTASFHVLETVLEEAKKLIKEPNAKLESLQGMIEKLKDAQVQLVKAPIQANDNLVSPEYGIHVQGVSDQHVKLFVQQIVDTNVLSAVLNGNKEFFKTATLEIAYHLKLTLEDQPYVSKQNLVVNINIPEHLRDKKLGIIHIHDDGSIEVLESHVAQDVISFETTQLSNYAIVSFNDPVMLPNKQPNTGDTTGLGSLCMLMFITGFAIFHFGKKVVNKKAS